MSSIKYLIIGGGISGLSFVNNLADSDSYLIIEKDDSLGGLCRTHYSGEYVWDYAGHFFHFASSEIKEYFNSHLNKNDLVSCKKSTKIYYRKQYIDFPFQKNIHQLKKSEFIECLYDLYFREDKELYDGFEDMLYSKFGKGITNKFLKPYNEKLYACNLQTLDTNAMGRFFPYADLDDIIKNMRITTTSSYNTYFEYPKRGAQTFIDILVKGIDYNKVLLNTAVKKVDILKKTVYLNNGECIEYEHLINSIPFNLFCKISNINNENVRLSCNQVLVFNIGFDGPLEVDDIHWIYYPGKEFVFYRVGFYNNILGKLNGSIYVEIGCEEQEIIDEKDINDIYKKVLFDLRKCGVLKNQKVVDYEFLTINPGYVHVTNQGQKWVCDKLAELDLHNVYSIGRYGAWTYCSMEDCILQAKELANKIGG